MFHLEYLFILLAFLVVTACIEIYYQLHIFDTWSQRILLSAFLFVVAVVWDTVAVARGHWNFSDTYNVGVTIGLLPLEEYLFAIVVPYFIITMYVFTRVRVR